MECLKRGGRGRREGGGGDSQKSSTVMRYKYTCKEKYKLLDTLVKDIIVTIRMMIEPIIIIIIIIITGEKKLKQQRGETTCIFQEKKYLLNYVFGQTVEEMKAKLLIYCWICQNLIVFHIAILSA